MKKLINDKDLEEIAKIIEKKIFVPKYEKKVTVFLCGGDISNDENARYKMSEVFKEYPRYEILYPEELFDDLLVGQGKHSLLTLENILAESVDAIVLFPESPGSFAELGAFSNNEALARKMIVVSDSKFKNEKSFINYGPNRLVKSSGTGKVIYIKYNDLTDLYAKNRIYRNINDHISKIKKKNPIFKNVANILEAEHFILPCVYLISDVEINDLVKLMHNATSQEKKLCEIATRSTLGKLVKKKLITRDSSSYQVTELGVEYVQSTFKVQHLDSARVELLNAENRRNSSVSYDRVGS